MKNPKWKRSKTHTKRDVRKNRVHVTLSHKGKIEYDDTRSALHDVSEQRDVEKALHESEALYHTLFENTGTAMLVIDDDTTVLAVNAELERISGYSKKELEGKRSWTEFVAKDRLEKMKEYHHLRRVDPKAAPRTYESKLINKQGNIIDALLTVSSIPGTRKSVVSFIDVTERKKMEKELENLAKYPTENPSPILRLDKNGVILHANKASNTLLMNWGKKTGDYAPKFWCDLVAELYRSKSSRSVDVECGKITYLFNVLPVVDYGYVNLYGRDITERKQIEERVDVERRRLFSLLDALPAVIALFARDYSIRFSNRYFRERFGDPGGRFCYEVLHNCKEPCEPCPSFRVFDTGKPEAWESQRSDGRTYMTYDYPFSDVDGSPLVLEVSYDITERKRLEDDLRKSEERFRIAAQSASDLVNEWNIVTGVVSWFGDVDEKLGYAPGEFPRTIDAWEKALHPDDHDRVMAAVERHFKTGETYDQEYHMRRKDGSYCYWMERGVALRGDKGSHARWIGTCTDITERKRMEKELASYTEHLEELVEKRTGELLGSERSLRLLTDALPALISYVDSEQRYRFNNRAYEEWFQHSRTEITGQRINEVLGETAYQAIQRYVAEALTGKKVTYESTVLYKDGRQRYIYATYVPDFDEQGKVKGFYALVNDITERKQMEQTLRKAERYAAIGEAAAMVGHDLRNPLQVIINRLYLAKKVTKDLSYPYSDVAAKLGLDELFKELEDQILYMNKIVTDLQDYSKPLKPELVETSLRQLIDNTFSMIQVPQNIQVSIEAFEHPKIMVDPGLMRRAFTNLIINAFQAMPSGGILTIRTSRTDDLAFISIRDTGVGIPRESIDRIFSPLYTTKAKGAGLGLPVCKRLIEAHNGNILVESQVGKGSTFTIKLPLTRGVN